MIKMSNCRELFASNFKYYVKKCNMNLREFSEKTDLKYQAVRSYAAGEYIPRPEVMDSIADFFKIPTYYLFADPPGIQDSGENDLFDQDSLTIIGLCNEHPIIKELLSQDLRDEQIALIEILAKHIDENGICIARRY